MYSAQCFIIQRRTVLVDKYPRTSAYMRVYSYSTVGVVEQKDMVNSGVGGRKKMNLRIEVASTV